jgi:hypothetical protein
MLVYQCASAQTDYLITNKGDSIAGEIKLLLYGPEKKVQIKADKKKEVYSILHIRYFSFKDEKYYPVRSPLGYLFMKIRVSGYLSLYAFQQENQSTYDGLFLSKADGESMEVPNLGFKKQMTKFLEDCGDVSSKIESGDLSKKDLEEIVTIYNKCIDDRTNNVAQVRAQQIEASIIVNSWDALETKVKESGDFEGKASALEMITDIKGKVGRSEKVPNYVIDGLKSILSSQENLKENLEKALADLQ